VHYEADVRNNPATRARVECIDVHLIADSGS
jgi:hypothetical protein